MTDYQLVEPQIEPFHDTGLLRFAVLNDIPGFSHCVTLRPWNMATHRGPQRELAAQRRRLICEQLRLSFDQLTVADQVHSPHVLRILPSDVGRGREGPTNAMKFTDGLICDLPGVAVMQFSADCPLILVVEPKRRVFGTVHASWRGTVTGIAIELIRQMRDQFQISSSELTACICPCAGLAEYEVGEDVHRIAIARLGEMERFFPRRSGKMYFDMRGANAAQLAEAGVRRDRIFAANISTMSDSRFYSHRGDGADTGRFAVIAGFRGE